MKIWGTIRSGGFKLPYYPPRPATGSHRYIVLLLCVVSVSLARAELDDLQGDKAVEAAAEGLRREASFPWYDSQEDGLRTLTLEEKQAPVEARDWTAKQKAKKTPKPRNWNFNFLEGFSTFLQLAAYGLLIALFLLALYFIVTSDAVRGFLQPVKSDEDENAVTDEQRMHNLPFEVRRPRTDLLTEARRLYEAGKYGEAMVYLFSYQLLQLDKNQWIRLAKGKTNRQYLREIRHRRELRGILQNSMVPFEDFFFGHYAIERERFESCWGRLDEFHRLIKAEGVTQ